MSQINVEKSIFGFCDTNVFFVRIWNFLLKFLAEKTCLFGPYNIIIQQFSIFKVL